MEFIQSKTGVPRKSNLHEAREKYMCNQRLKALSLLLMDFF